MHLIWALWLARLRQRRLSHQHSESLRESTLNTSTILALVFLTLSLVFGSASAQDFATISGTVTDSLLGDPIGGVVVTAMPDGKSTVTTAAGYFRLVGLNPGSITLQIESSFHFARSLDPVLLREGEERTLAVALMPLTFSSTRVEVNAERDAGPGATNYAVTSSDRRGVANVGEFLNRKGLHLESDGRTQYAALRGFSPQSVLILLDGVPVNPDGSPADLSLISIESIDRVEVYTSSASSRFGANALGGAVNIVSRTRTEPARAGHLDLSQGSYGLRKGAVDLALPQAAGVGVLFDYDYQQQRNDFPYEHPYEGELRRINNAARVYSSYLSLRPIDLSTLLFQARISNSHQGLPGAIFQETGPGALAKRENRSYSLAYSQSGLNLYASYRELRQKFTDLTGFIAYDRDYLQAARSMRGDYQRVFWSFLSLSAGAEATSENFFNDDRVAPQRSLPEVGRRTWATSAGILATRMVHKLELSAEGRYRLDRIDGESRGSPFAGASAEVHLPVTFGIEGSYGESFRLPPIDALFWRGDVFSEANPDLRPEAAINREAGLKLSFKRGAIVEAKHTWFESEVENLITWRRQFDGKYKPVNVDRSHYSGSESSIALAPANRRFELAYHRTALEATNLSIPSGYYGETIPFKPELVERLSLDVDLKYCRLQYSYSYTGVRQIREANTKQLPGYALHDLALEIPVSLWARQHSLRAAIYNITDERYELLERMPMPPRSASLSLKIQI
jgi:vitamin B12 transporter